jgi:hypothetical protein
MRLLSGNITLLTDSLGIGLIYQLIAGRGHPLEDRLSSRAVCVAAWTHRVLSGGEI